MFLLRFEGGRRLFACMIAACMALVACDILDMVLFPLRMVTVDILSFVIPIYFLCIFLTIVSLFVAVAKQTCSIGWICFVEFVEIAVHGLALFFA